MVNSSLGPCNHLLLDQMIVDNTWHDGDSNNLTASIDDGTSRVIGQANDILSVNLQQVVVGKHAVSGRRRVLDHRVDSAVFVAEADSVCRVLVQGDLFTKT